MVDAGSGGRSGPMHSARAAPAMPCHASRAERCAASCAVIARAVTVVAPSKYRRSVRASRRALWRPTVAAKSPSRRRRGNRRPAGRVRTDRHPRPVSREPAAEPVSGSDGRAPSQARPIASTARRGNLHEVRPGGRFAGGPASSGRGQYGLASDARATAACRPCQPEGCGDGGPPVRRPGRRQPAPRPRGPDALRRVRGSRATPVRERADPHPRGARAVRSRGGIRTSRCGGAGASSVCAPCGPPRGGGGSRRARETARPTRSRLRCRKTRTGERGRRPCAPPRPTGAPGGAEAGGDARVPRVR